MLGLGFAEIFILPFILIVVVGLPILFVIFIGSLFFRRRGVSRRDRTQWNEETRIMQEMHDNLSAMESRIEALETILLERFGKDKR